MLIFNEVLYLVIQNMKCVYKNLFYPLFCAAFVVTASCAKQEAVESPQGENDGPIVINEAEAFDAVRGELLIKLRSTASSQTKSVGSAGDALEGTREVAKVLGGLGQFRLERLFPECGKFEARTKAEGLDCWYIASYDKELVSRDVVRQLKKCGSIEYIEYPLDIKSADEDAFAPFTVVPDRIAPARTQIKRTAKFPFNESEDVQQRQWHYNNTGLVFGNESLAGADANVWAAWNLAQGNPDVVVAVIDQGVKFDHEDLADNMWVNEGEIPGNDVDDDGNGYVDDVYGYNFITNNGNITVSETLYHGTHVAGTIAAVNNNGKGVNGIAGGSGNGDGVRIMSLQTLGSGDNGSSGSGLGGAVRAMKYAADNGAVICQNSWGYNTKVSWNSWTRNSYGALRRAMDYFIKYAGVDENGEQSGPMKGGLIIFAAGNDGVNYDSYPAADKMVVSVASCSYNGVAAIYSNYGTWIDITAPGGDTTLSDASYGGVYSTIVGEGGTDAYGYSQGTSMACPHVSGACALAVSYYYGKEKRKGLTPDVLRAALLSSAQPFRQYLSEAYVGNMGVGILDTWNLLHYMDYTEDIPDQFIQVGSTLTIDLKEYFPTVQIISYTNPAPEVVRVELSGDNLLFTGLSAGETIVTLSDGRAIYKKIDIIVSK